MESNRRGLSEEFKRQLGSSVDKLQREMAETFRSSRIRHRCNASLSDTLPTPKSFQSEAGWPERSPIMTPITWKKQKKSVVPPAEEKKDDDDDDDDDSDDDADDDSDDAAEDRTELTQTIIDSIVSRAKSKRQVKPTEAMADFIQGRR